jgi:hypothetical protein
MFKIKLPADRAEPDMTAVGSAFGISTKDVHDGIAIGTISRWFEVGTGDADNKPHQIFASDTLGIRVDVDESGKVRSVEKYDEVSAILRSHPGEDGDAGAKKSLMEETLMSNTHDNSDAARHAHLSALLDEALDDSFPASDPIAISFESPNRATRPLKKSDDGRKSCNG